MSYQFYPTEKIEKKVSLSIRVIDDYTLKEPIGWINISIKGSNSVPVKNPSGYYVFFNLPTDNYVIVEVTSQYYFCTETTVYSNDFLNANFPVVDIYLIPNSSYLFNKNTVLLRGIVRESINGKNGKYLSKAKVKAWVCSDKASNARLTNVPVKKGDQNLMLTEILGAIVAGDSLMIKDVNKTKKEVVTIVSYEKSDSPSKKFNIALPLKFDHNGKTPLIPVLNTFTNEKGEFVVYFRTLAIDTFTVSLQVHYPDYITCNQEVDITVDKQTFYVDIEMKKV